MFIMFSENAAMLVQVAKDNGIFVMCLFSKHKQN